MHIPWQVDSHLGCNFTRVERNHSRLDAFAFDFGGHMAQCLIQSSFGRRVRRKAVLILEKCLGGTRITRDERDAAYKGVGSDQTLSTYYGTDGIHVDVVGEITV